MSCFSVFCVLRGLHIALLQVPGAVRFIGPSDIPGTNVVGAENAWLGHPALLRTEGLDSHT